MLTEQEPMMLADTAGENFHQLIITQGSLDTIQFGHEYSGRAVFPEEGGKWGDGNERTNAEA